MVENIKKHILMILGLICGLGSCIAYFCFSANVYACAISILIYAVIFLVCNLKNKDIEKDVEISKNILAFMYSMLIQYMCMAGCIIEHNNGGLRHFVYWFIVIMITSAYIVNYRIIIKNPASRKYKFIALTFMIFVNFMMCNALEVFWAVLVSIPVMAAFSVYENKKLKLILVICINITNIWGVYRQIGEVCKGDGYMIWAYILEAIIMIVYTVAYTRTSNIITDINKMSLNDIEKQRLETVALSNETVEIGKIIKKAVDETTTLVHGMDVATDESIDIVCQIEEKNVNNTGSIDVQLMLTDKVLKTIDVVSNESNEANQKKENTLGAMIKNKEAFNHVKTKSNDIVEYNKKLTDVINKFVVNVKKVKKILSDIVEVSEKIDSLSLNASVESARAGEVEKEFSVVSNEIKNLSDATALLIHRINKVVNELEVNALTARNSVLEVIEEIDGENEIIDVTMKEFDNIEDYMENLNSSIKAILESVNNVAGFSSNMERHSRKLIETNKIVNENTKETLNISKSNKEKVQNTVDIMKELYDVVSELDKYVTE